MAKIMDDPSAVNPQGWGEELDSTPFEATLLRAQTHSGMNVGFGDGRAVYTIEPGSHSLHFPTDSFVQG